MVTTVIRVLESVFHVAHVCALEDQEVWPSMQTLVALTPDLKKYSAIAIQDIKVS